MSLEARLVCEAFDWLRKNTVVGRVPGQVVYIPPRAIEVALRDGAPYSIHALACRGLVVRVPPVLQVHDAPPCKCPPDPAKKSWCKS